MTTIITSLPHLTNDGKPTLRQRSIFFATLLTNGVKFTTEEPCFGYWYADDGTLYDNQETTLVTAHGSEMAIRAAVATFGETVGEIEMLFVERVDGFLAGTATGHDGAAGLAKQFGGATLLPDGTAISLNYNALVSGVDYSAANLVR